MIVGLDGQFVELEGQLPGPCPDCGLILDTHAEPPNSELDVVQDLAHQLAKEPRFSLLGCQVAFLGCVESGGGGLLVGFDFELLFPVRNGLHAGRS